MDAVSHHAPAAAMVVPGADPPPGAPTDDTALPTNDLGATLLGIIMRSVASQSDQAAARIEHANEVMERARAEAEAALRRAREAEDEAGIWGAIKDVLGDDIATLASVVAATAVTISTSGTAAPAILALAAAGMSATATLGSRLGLDPKVCALLGTAGALLGLAGGRFVPSEDLAALAKGARIVEAGAAAASGGATVVEGDYRAQAMHARADQKAAEHSEREARFQIDVALSILEEAAHDLQRARRATSEIQSTHDEGQSAVIARIGAA